MLHTIIDELIDKDVKRCHNHSTKLMEDLEQIEQKHTETDDKIQEMLTTFEKTTMTGLDIIEYYDKLSSLVEKMEANVDIAEYRDMLIYQEGEVDRRQLQRMVGDVKEIKKESSSSERVEVLANAKPENDKPVTAKMEPKKQATAKSEPAKHVIKQPATAQFFSLFRSKNVLISEPNKIEKVTETDKAKKVSESPDQLSAFCHNRSPVHCIRAVSQDKVWVKYYEKDQFRLLNKSGEVQDIVPYPTTNQTFFVMNDKGFISSHYENQVVVSIDHFGKITGVIMNTSPLFPAFVGPALSGNILVTLIDNLALTRTVKSKRKIQMITPAGGLLHTYEFGDDETTPLFSFPANLIQNFNFNVCVINGYQTADDSIRGNVCIFYEDGGLKFLYSGQDGDFRPVDICCDSLCNIICVSDLDDSVHVIDSDGAFLKYMLTSDTCVPGPTSIALYNDTLWVGSGTGEIRVYHYQL